MKESKEKLNMRSGTAAVLIIATLLIAGSLIFIAAQPGEDPFDDNTVLGAAPTPLKVGDNITAGPGMRADGIIITGVDSGLSGSIDLSLVKNALNEDVFVEGIDHNAFAGTAITSIDLRSAPSFEANGEGLTHIGYEAFKDCASLKSVIVGETVQEFGDRAFEGCIELSTMTLPVKGSPLDPVGSHLEISFGVGCFDNAILFNFNVNLPFFTGLEYSEDGGSTWVAIELAFSTVWDPSEHLSAFKIRPTWKVGKIITFKNGAGLTDSGGSPLKDVSIMKIVGSEFTLSSAYQQACLDSGEAANYFESNNLNRVIYYWANEDTGEKSGFAADFKMVDDVTFTVAPGNGWSVKPGGDESGKKGGPFGLDGTFFWLLVLLIIILLAILAAYMVSKRRKQD